MFYLKIGYLRFQKINLNNGFTLECFEHNVDSSILFAKEKNFCRERFKEFYKFIFKIFEN